jgi:ribosomal protein S18 acetylase RimI-like enzyme
VKLVPATALDLPALVELFNDGYSEYLVPMRMDEPRLREHVETNGIDLDCSRIAVEELPAAFALIALRGAAGWVGGVGTVPSRRERGLGERVLLAAIEAAHARGCRKIWLEVIDRNLPALRLYEKLGFEPVRDLLVWLLPPTGPARVALQTVEADFAHAWIVRNRGSREPWQRADEAVESVRARGSALRGLVIERVGKISAAALLAEREDKVSVLQVVALDSEAARAALLAAADGKHSVGLTNVPEDDPASGAMRELGARLVARQHELRLML